MPRVRCLYFNCLYLDDDICTASTVEIDPDIGCTTYAQSASDLLSESDDYDDWDSEDIDMEMVDEVEMEDDDRDWLND
ncbi:MAG: hypothetical protein HN390_05860 [Anaerolineae bacterium]|jgi:hypothetical protein|nr:hypothetical protein [Anaerolineae bacterium]MBT7191346.1 hypothetical protein [Anaerolineae bacterium]MBT7992210.1 hypothetical protein [Anaerolineae bacterium]